MDKLAKDGTRRGRPEGSANKMAREAREAARASGNGKLPHEILLDMARGIPVEMLVLDEQTGKPLRGQDGKEITRLAIPTLDEMKDAAKAAAPYFAPKISTVEVLAGASEDDLDRLIAVFAAEAGVSLTAGPEGQNGEATPGPGEDPAPRAGDGETEGGERGPEPTAIRRRPITGT
jgi:hypothetical protein